MPLPKRAPREHTEAWEQAFAQGCVLSLEEALSEALEVGDGTDDNGIEQVPNVPSR